MDLDDDYRALRHDAGVVELARDLLSAKGPDAASFLQGQLSQDVAGLAVGASADSLLLQPQGKVEALLRVTRVTTDELVLDVDGGWGEAVMARLNRFKLRVRVDLAPLAWKCLALRGPRARQVVADGGCEGLAIDVDWPGLVGVDLVGEAPVVPDAVRRCGVAAWEALRIEAGLPAMGSELTERTIPAEAGVVDRTVSFTKGCFTGQELVARIDSRGGNVPRHLRAVVVVGDAVPPVGAVVESTEAKEVGALTSVAWSPSLAATIALAYVRREVSPPAEVGLRWDKGAAAATVRSLPLVD
ncbi:MAG: YgfZ/GcvT domain-containing protein [Acidimicrobiales bacterium]